MTDRYIVPGVLRYENIILSQKDVWAVFNGGSPVCKILSY